MGSWVGMLTSGGCDAFPRDSVRAWCCCLFGEFCLKWISERVIHCA